MDFTRLHFLDSFVSHVAGATGPKSNAPNNEAREYSVSPSSLAVCTAAGSKYHPWHGIGTELARLLSQPPTVVSRIQQVEFMFHSPKLPLHVEGLGAALRITIENTCRTIIDQAWKFAFSTTVERSCGVVFAAIEVPMRP
jgi:hypothetical protein